jgi:hypothetical protein
MKNRLIPVIASLAVALSFVHCTDRRIKSKSNIESLYKNSKYLNETAAFLAGAALDPGASLYPLTQDRRYESYSKQIGKIWEQCRTRNLENIEKWREAHMPGVCSGTVMYPFSGPDILNALAFFPGSERFIMIGLEPPGNVPDPLHYKGGDVYAGLWRIKYALRTILKLNLFRTSEMMTDFEGDACSNITGIMMFFLARYGYDILDVRKIYISGSGVLAYNPPKSEAKITRGVEFIFRKNPDSPVQNASYISADLSDRSLSRLLGFSSFLSRQKNFSTLIKSASYLLSYDNFKIMRSYLLACSRCIIQEDSGIPYRYFPPSEWRVSLYGRYRVLEIFSHRFQRDLDEAMKGESAGLLPFSFGYGFIPRKSNLMIAEKKYRPAH